MSHTSKGSVPLNLGLIFFFFFLNVKNYSEMEPTKRFIIVSTCYIEIGIKFDCC